MCVFQLALQMDALEQYLKIEKMDPSQITEQAIEHKETKYSEMNSQFGDVESRGKKFIKEASEVSHESGSSVTESYFNC